MEPTTAQNMRTRSKLAIDLINGTYTIIHKLQEGMSKAEKSFCLFGEEMRSLDGRKFRRAE